MNCSHTQGQVHVQSMRKPVILNQLFTYYDTQGQVHVQSMNKPFILNQLSNMIQVIQVWPMRKPVSKFQQVL